MLFRNPGSLMKFASLLFVFRHKGIQHRNMAMLRDVGVGESSIRKYLIADPSEPKTGDKIAPREMRGAHFISVIPEPVSKPSLVIASQSCMNLLNIDPGEAKTELFASVFGGNTVLPNMGTPYCTTYGCHSFGHYFGQMGDGRAVTIGEMLSKSCKDKGSDSGDIGHYSAHIQELQLKGGGRSPCSRGFDGRAVLRSCTREFLVSEAMHSLGIPTTRALSIVATGEPVTRAWYLANSSANTYAERFGGSSDACQAIPKFPPDRLFREPGAVLCRVSRSFLRFGHLELFGMRKEFKELIQMADYVCFKEYTHLLSIDSQTSSGATVSCDQVASVQLPKTLPTGSPQRYVSLYRSVAKRSAALMAEWLRVGYVHGNMNSDNCLLSGAGLDYGPFGWMEGYNRNYQPFTTDVSGDFRFCNQPNAMQLNLIVMGEAAFTELVLQTSKVKYDQECEAHLQEIKNIGEKEYEAEFLRCYDDVKRRKLGLLTFTSTDDADEIPMKNGLISDSQLWGTLEALMHRQGCDFTILFRELAKAADLSSDFTNNVSEEHNRSVASRALLLLAPSVYDTKFEIQKDTDWVNWMEHYLFRIKSEGQDPVARRAVQNLANPKYVLRNWMSTLAYESALEGDYSVLEELHTLLQQPYEDQSHVMQSKWYSKTPTWARNLPGVAFLSCSS